MAFISTRATLFIEALLCSTVAGIANAATFRTSQDCFNEYERVGVERDARWENWRRVCGTSVKGQCGEEYRALDKMITYRSQLHSYCLSMRTAERNHAQNKEMAEKRQEEANAKHNREMGYGLAGGGLGVAANAATSSGMLDRKPKQIVVPNPPGRSPPRAVETITQHNSGPSGTETVAKNMGAAVVGMIVDAFTAPDDDSAVSTVNRATIPMANIVRDGAMVGESGAAANATLSMTMPVLNRQLRDIESSLDGTIQDMQEIGTPSPPPSSIASGTQYRGTPIRSYDTTNPWQNETHAEPVANNPYSEVARSSTNSDTRGTVPPSMGSTGTTQPPLDNPWRDQEVMASSTYSPHSGTFVARSEPRATCEMVRTGEVKYKFQWKDKAGNRCYSNTGENKDVAACCP